MGLWNGISNALFGKSGYEQQKLMTGPQEEQYNKMLSQGGALTGGAYDALGAGIAEGYNPYDSVGSQRILGEMKGNMRNDFNNEVGNMSSSNVGRFGSGFNKVRTGLVDAYNRNVTDLDYKDLMNQQQMGQQAYGNKMDAVNALLGNQSNLLNRQAVQNKDTQSMGITQFAGGIGGIASMGKKLIGG